MLNKDWVFFAVQIALMYVFGALANAFHSLLPAVIWMALTLALGLSWERIVGPKNAEHRHSEEVAKPFVRAFAYLCGVAAAAIVSATDFMLWHTRGLMPSLVGVQFYIPLGAFLLGAIVSTIYIWVLALLKARLRMGDLYVMASLAILSFVGSYLIFFHNENAVLSASSVVEIAKREFSGQTNKLFGLAPILPLTPLIQFIGYVVGSWVVYWREERRVRMSV
jgi:hypothetical protein